MYGKPDSNASIRIPWTKPGTPFLLEKMTSDLAAALSLLDQTADLSREIEEKAWTTPCDRFRDSTLGQHVRHCLEHFEALLSITPDGDLDYDHRRRDASIENFPQAAYDRSRDLGKRLAEMGETYGPTHTINVRTSCSCDGEVSAQVSSFGRELQFLVSHTVHHFAIIAAICNGQGIDLPENFGVAPSTLKYREALANA